MCVCLVNIDPDRSSKKSELEVGTRCRFNNRPAVDTTQIVMSSWRVHGTCKTRRPLFTLRPKKKGKKKERGLHVYMRSRIPEWCADDIYQSGAGVCLIRDDDRWRLGPEKTGRLAPGFGCSSAPAAAHGEERSQGATLMLPVSFLHGHHHLRGIHKTTNKDPITRVCLPFIIHDGSHVLAETRDRLSAVLWVG